MLLKMVVMYLVLSTYLLTCLCADQSSNSDNTSPLPQNGGKNDSDTSVHGDTLKPSPNSTSNKTTSNASNTSDSEGVMKYIKDKNGAVMRAFVVVVGVTAMVVIYFVVRAVRLRRKRSKSRKYGIIAKSGDVEMTPLDQDDDDEEMTVFEAPNHTRK